MSDGKIILLSVIKHLELCHDELSRDCDKLYDHGGEVYALVASELETIMRSMERTEAFFKKLGDAITVLEEKA